MMENHHPMAILGRICSIIERHLAELEAMHQSIEDLLAIAADLSKDEDIF